MRLFYYNPKPVNFGDALSPVIVDGINGSPVKTINFGEEKRYGIEHFVFALGSIFHFAKDGDVIWGTGINPYRQNPQKLKHLSIRAVRGPLTRDFIQNTYRLDCPATYGDPALLLPKLLPQKFHNPVRRIGIIPHLADEQLVEGSDNVIISVYQPWEKVLDFILGCELIISSALHAIIVAEAFGVPARWLRNASLPSFKTEPAFKFNDYYISTFRSPDDWAESIEDGIRKGGKVPIPSHFSTLNLETAFPYKELKASSFILSTTSRVFSMGMHQWRRITRKLTKI